ncbi:hypothetical protein C8R43DRAFT_1121602 [Mycena crocata]|nr:hypothetical protein C8R43DRAFT_1121602 [Mycena crocata]
MDLLPDADPSVTINPVAPARALKDYLIGPKSNILPAHGWTQASVLFNHIEENIAKVMDKPVSSLVAVIIGRDRPSDRAMAADAIADAIANTGLATQDEFMVIPATPKEGDPDAPILPHTNFILCTSSQLKDKIIADPTKAIIHTKRKDESDGLSFYLLPALPEPSWFIVLKIIQEHHDRVPDARDIPFVIRVLLEYAEVKPCQVWMPGRRGSGGQRQNAVRLYMPPPSLEEDAIKTWKAHLTSPSFTFIVDCRGRATPFKPEAARAGRARPMECTECLGLDHYKDECPIVTSSEFRAVHLNQAEIDATHIGTSLSTIRDRDEVDPDGFRKVARRTFNPRFTPGGSNRRGGPSRVRR